MAADSCQSVVLVVEVAEAVAASFVDSCPPVVVEAVRRTVVQAVVVHSYIQMILIRLSELVEVEASC
jgi:hypothetical protein